MNSIADITIADDSDAGGTSKPSTPTVAEPVSGTADIPFDYEDCNDVTTAQGADAVGADTHEAEPAFPSEGERSMDLAHDEFEDSPASCPSIRAHIERAEQAFSDLLAVRDEKSAVTKRQESEEQACVAWFIANVYAPHEAFRPHPAAYQEFLNERNVEPSRLTKNKYLATFKAVVRRYDRRFPPSLLTALRAGCHGPS
jgi:hypothetical protein